MDKKRIIELATETTLKDGQYVAIDHTTDGTKKLNLGAELTDLKEELENISGISDDVKVALLQIASKVAYIDDDGQDYYDDLYNALYPPADLVSISAVYTQSGVVYAGDSLDTLKADLVVTALYDDQTTQTVTTYELSGTLEAGTSTVTVSYGGKTTTFTVTVTAGFYPLTLTAESVGVGFGSTDSTKNTNTPPYIANTNKGRIYYLSSDNLGCPVEEGKSYRITITSSLGTEGISLMEFNEDGVTQITNTQAVSSGNKHEISWTNLSSNQYIYTPSTISNKPAKNIWLLFRKNTNNSTWSSLDDSIFPVTIEEITT